MIINEIKNISVDKVSYNSLSVSLDVNYDEEKVNEYVDAELHILSDTNRLVFEAELDQAGSSSGSSSFPTSLRTNLTKSFTFDIDIYIEDTGGASDLVFIIVLKSEGLKKQALLSI